MKRLLTLLLLACLAAPASAADAPKKPQEPGTSVEMPYLIAPLAGGDRLVAYAYISSKILATSPSAAMDIRDKTPFIQDAFVRDVNGATIGMPADPTKIDSANLKARLLSDLRRVMGAGKVAGIEIVAIQIAQLRPGS
jgi:hypothetical protein